MNVNLTHTHSLNHVGLLSVNAMLVDTLCGLASVAASAQHSSSEDEESSGAEEKEDEDEKGAVPSSPPTILKQDLLKIEKEFEIDGSVEDALFNEPTLPSMEALIATAAKHPLKSYLATQTAVSYDINIPRCKKKDKDLERDQTALKEEYGRHEHDRKEADSLLAVALQNQAAAKEAYETATIEVGILQERSQELSSEMISKQKTYVQAGKDQEICRLLKLTMEHLANLHRTPELRFKLPFSNISEDGLKELAEFFELSGADYDCIQKITVRKHVVIARALIMFGFTYSPAYAAVMPGNFLQANKGCQKEDLVRQTCRCFGVEIPDGKIVANDPKKTSKKRKKSTEMTPGRKRKSSKVAPQAAETVVRVCSILSSPDVQAALASAVQKNVTSPVAGTSKS